MESWGNVPAEEFATWLSPQEALNAITSDWVVACSELVRRLKVGRARAAGDLAWRHDGTTQTAARRLILPEWWDDIDYIGTPMHPLWQTGGVTFLVKVGRDAPRRAQECFDLKFDRVGILPAARSGPPQLPRRPPLSAAELLAAIRGESTVETLNKFIALHGATTPSEPAPTPKQPPAAPRPKRKPTGKAAVTFPEFQLWFDDLSPADKALGYRGIWRLARSHFKGRRVPKKHPEEMVKGRPVGRRRKAAEMPQ